VPTRPLPALLLTLPLVACTTLRRDEPGMQRAPHVTLPPLFSSSSSQSGRSHGWWALFGLVARDVEAERVHTRALPFFWHVDDPPYAEETVVPLVWYSRESPAESTRIASLLWGRSETPERTTSYGLIPLFRRTCAADGSFERTTLFPLLDVERHGEARDVTLLPLFGLAHLAAFRTGRPAEGPTVPAFGRASSGRTEILDVLGLVSLFGHDDVGDTREIRALTLLSSETLSLFRSWRSRGPDDPFTREWLFPLYMNVQDEDGGFSYVGPLAGSFVDRVEDERTDWWLAGLVTRTRSDEDERWRVLGIPLG